MSKYGFQILNLDKHPIIVPRGSRLKNRRRPEVTIECLSASLDRLRERKYQEAVEQIERALGQGSLEMESRVVLCEAEELIGRGMFREALAKVEAVAERENKFKDGGTK